MPSSQRHLLLICSDLRAESLAGSFRVRCFIKYLRRLDWRISAFVPSDDSRQVQDCDAGLRVQSSGIEAPSQRWRRALQRLTLAPDPFVRWVRKSSDEILRFASRDRPDAVLVSSPPHSIQAIGVHLHRELGIPFIADFRDDWISNHRQRWPTPWHHWVASQQEERCVKYANRVILNTSEVHRRFTSRYPKFAEKLSVLTNGYDDEDFGRKPLSPIENEAKLPARVYYAGASYGDYMDHRLGQLATALLDAGQGGIWELVSLGAGQWRGAGLPPMWRHLGSLDAAAAASELERASVLLLPMPPGEREPSGTVPLKAYGYLRSGRAIVYLGERGSTSELLQSFPGTYCLGREGWSSLANWLIRHRDELNHHFIRAGVGAFSFSHLTKCLDSHLREAAGASGHRTYL